MGFGHTMDNEDDFAKDTKLCAAMLTGPQDAEDGSEVCILPSGEEVNFYQVIPLYRDELEYKLAYDADALRPLVHRTEPGDVAVSGGSGGFRLCGESSAEKGQQE